MAQIVTDGDLNQERTSKILAELRRGLDFHASAFKEIDEKAKYWLTVCIPSLVALIGYISQQGSNFNSIFLSISTALALCLFLSVYFFSATIGSISIAAGIAIPEDQKADSCMFYTRSSEIWEQYEHIRIEKTLRALLCNETQSRHKGRKLRIAEALLFRAVPTAACISGIGTALIDACVTHWWWAGPRAPIGAGVVIGSGTAAVFWFLAHRQARKV